MYKTKSTTYFLSSWQSFIDDRPPFFSGIPPPTVVWLKNGEVVDEEREHDAKNGIENRLHWPTVSRQDLNSIFTCQASNTKLMDPRQASVTLDLRCE